MASTLESKQRATGRWQTMPFSEAVDVNPVRKIPKGTAAKFVSMADLKEFNRKIQGHEVREYKGGARFQNGDTIMARITPCLENGKTAYVDILDETEIAGGSTEFIVLSGKEGKTTNQFVYYLATSPEIRAQAIQAMTGTSGRQRVEPDIFNKIPVSIPTLSEQERIAKILSELDDKIELNNRMNKTLEAMGQALFKHWFVDFEFPWDFKNNKFDPSGKPYKSSGGKMVPSSLGPIPEVSQVGCLGDFGKIQPGYAFKSKDFIESGIKVIKIRNIQNSIIDITDTDCVNESVFQSTDEKFYLRTGDILVAMTGAELGKVGIVPQVDSPMLLNQRVGKVHSTYPLLCYLILKGNVAQSFMKGVSSASSAQGNISNTDIEDIKLVVGADDVIMYFAEITNPLFLQLVQNLGESLKLAQARDSFLPKLMSGEIWPQ